MASDEVHPLMDLRCDPLLYALTGSDKDDQVHVPALLHVCASEVPTLPPG